MCIPYALVPGMDIHSVAYKRAVQIVTGAKHVHFAAIDPDEGKLSALILSLAER